jgi:signal transduction histidine kinase
VTRHRLSVRLRLTFLYGALFLVAGLFLLVLIYLLMRRSLDESAVFRISETFIDANNLAVSTPAGPDVLVGAPEAIVGLEEERVRLRDATLRELLTQASVALTVAALLSAGIGWWVSGRVLRPVHDITAVARRLSEERLHERISLEGPHDELRELADTFDGMLARLEAAFEAQRRFAANVSHELRNPLAIIRTEIDVALANPEVDPDELRAMGETVRSATERSERVIAALMTLARSSQPVTTHEDVDLAELLRAALASLSTRLGDRGISLELAPAQVRGDRALLEQMVANLLENADRYNVANGTIGIRTWSEAGRALLEIANDGERIAKSDVETLFEPFRRHRPDRTGSDQGTGLGLSIVRAIATAHGGTATAGSIPTGGLVVRVTLPVAR